MKNKKTDNPLWTPPSRKPKPLKTPDDLKVVVRYDQCDSDFDRKMLLDRLYERQGVRPHFLNEEGSTVPYTPEFGVKRWGRTVLYNQFNPEVGEFEWTAALAPKCIEDLLY
jgi:hypothetical protein